MLAERPPAATAARCRFAQATLYQLLVFAQETRLETWRCAQTSTPTSHPKRRGSPQGAHNKGWKTKSQPPITSGRAMCCGDVGSGESPRGGTGGRAETTHAQHRSPHTPVVISCEQPPGLQRPFIDSAEPNPISPIVSSLAPSTPLWPRAEGQARGLRVVPLPTRDAARPRCTPHSTARLPALGWHPSPRAARSYILFSLSSSFGNWNLLWCQKVADNIKCIPLSWCCTLLNLQQHKYHKNYKNCKLTTDFLVQWHK